LPDTHNGFKLGIFKQLLQYKSNRVVESDPYHTTVDCSKCGNKVPKVLATRLHKCDRCGTVYFLTLTITTTTTVEHSNRRWRKSFAKATTDAASEIYACGNSEWSL
jgi:phage FluMu protein Com